MKPVMLYKEQKETTSPPYSIYLPCGIKMHFIDSSEALEYAVKELSRFNVLAIDLEGEDFGRDAKISVIQISTGRNSDVFLLDVHALGKQVFMETKEGSLVKILENAFVKKLFWDLRGDQSALFHNFGVRIQGAEDLQMWEVATRVIDGNPASYLMGLGQMIQFSGYVPMSETEKDTVQVIKARARKLFAPQEGGSLSVWRQRPLPEVLLEYCTDTRLLFPIYIALQRKVLIANLGAPHAATATALAIRRSTERRVREACEGERASSPSSDLTTGEEDYQTRVLQQGAKDMRMRVVDTVLVNDVSIVVTQFPPLPLDQQQSLLSQSTPQGSTSGSQGQSSLPNTPAVSVSSRQHIPFVPSAAPGRQSSQSVASSAAAPSAPSPSSQPQSSAMRFAFSPTNAMTARPSTGSSSSATQAAIHAIAAAANSIGSSMKQPALLTNPPSPTAPLPPRIPKVDTPLPPPLVVRAPPVGSWAAKVGGGVGGGGSQVAPLKSEGNSSGDSTPAGGSDLQGMYGVVANEDTDRESVVSLSIDIPPMSSESAATTVHATPKQSVRKEDGISSNEALMMPLFHQKAWSAAGAGLVGLGSEAGYEEDDEESSDEEEDEKEKQGDEEVMVLGKQQVRDMFAAVNGEGVVRTKRGDGVSLLRTAFAMKASPQLNPLVAPLFPSSRVVPSSTHQSFSESGGYASARNPLLSASKQRVAHLIGQGKLEATKKQLTTCDHHLQQAEAASAYHRDLSPNEGKAAPDHLQAAASTTASSYAAGMAGSYLEGVSSSVCSVHSPALPSLKLGGDETSNVSPHSLMHLATPQTSAGASECLICSKCSHPVSPPSSSAGAPFSSPKEPFQLDNSMRSPPAVQAVTPLTASSLNLLSASLAGAVQRVALSSLSKAESNPPSNSRDRSDVSMLLPSAATPLPPDSQATSGMSSSSPSGSSRSDQKPPSPALSWSKPVRLFKEEGQIEVALLSPSESPSTQPESPPASAPQPTALATPPPVVPIIVSKQLQSKELPTALEELPNPPLPAGSAWGRKDVSILPSAPSVVTSSLGAPLPLILKKHTPLTTNLPASADGWVSVGSKGISTRPVVTTVEVDRRSKKAKA